MPSFVLSGSSTTAQTLEGLQTGILTNSDAELVVSGGDAITVNNSLSGGTNYLVVNGLVYANSTQVTHAAVDHDGAFLEINVGSTGKLVGLAGNAILSNVSGALRLYNSGEISTNGTDPIDIRASDIGATISVVNTGLIQGQSSAIATISGIAQTRIINTGTIVASAGIAIYANWAGTGNGTSYLNNSGTIIGPVGSLTANFGDGMHIVRNSGLMDGDVLLGENDDRYEGAGGQVLGVVSGGDDNDTLGGGAFRDEFDGGTGLDVLVGRGGDDSLAGGQGDDLLLGGDGNDEMDGGSENDTLNGNAGDDSIRGGTGNDVLVGQDGSDFLEGEDGQDTLDGGDGDDVLEGGADNDILRGRAGEDELAGGLGRDFLTGGQDADQFVFRALAETVTGANRDQILDFEQGVDSIIVASLSPGVFEFRGTAAFDPSGNPELRLLETATGSTIVQFDADGDGIADAEIRVAGVTGLTADDFVL